MTNTVDLQIISDNPAVQARYEQMRAAGESHNIAEMLATRQAPRSVTDREFLSGECSGNQFVGDEKTGNRYRAIAEAAGVSVTGKVYKGSLARFPGDPKAWVNGRGDVKRRCIEENWSCDGMVTHRATPRQAPSVPLAQDIVDQHVTQKILDDPSQASRRTELEAEVREKHTPHWHKKKRRGA
ncbi:MAG TPA: hypothetical protein VM243_11935 [Phycisphaerae bacterium]|nr:hypothetical protein [Phycisphaerae bacterium]